MQIKLKQCDGCKELKHIWKKHSRNLYCKECWYKHPDRDKKPEKAKKPINKKSSKQEKLEIVYNSIRKIYLAGNPFCKAKLPGCNLNATDIHHKCGRGRYMLDTTTFLAVCRLCHDKIENDPVMAKAMGFSESREEKYGNKE